MTTARSVRDRDAQFPKVLRSRLAQTLTDDGALFVSDFCDTGSQCRMQIVSKCRRDTVKLPLPHDKSSS